MIRKHIYNFSFTPEFFLFFKRFNYIPPSIKSKKVLFRRSLTFNYFFSNLTKRGRKQQILNLFNLYLFKQWKILEQFNKYKINYHIYFFNTQEHLYNFFSGFNFLFFFFFSKLNKKLLKFSNYKRPRYSIHLLYIPPYRRLRTFLRFNIKSIFYFEGKTFEKRLYNFFSSLIFNTSDSLPMRYSTYIQNFILRKRKHTALLK